MIAIPWFVLSTTGSATQTGLVAAAEITPLVHLQGARRPAARPGRAAPGDARVRPPVRLRRRRDPAAPPPRAADLPDPARPGRRRRCAARAGRRRQGGDDARRSRAPPTVARARHRPRRRHRAHLDDGAAPRWPACWSPRSARPTRSTSMPPRSSSRSSSSRSPPPGSAARPAVGGRRPDVVRPGAAAGLGLPAHRAGADRDLRDGRGRPTWSTRPTPRSSRRCGRRSRAPAWRCSARSSR